MEPWLLGLEGAVAPLRASRWGYAGVNAAHILGLALLVGAIVPMNLRLLGLWGSLPRDRVAGLLLPVAASGLALAMTTGLALFAVRAREYAALSPFQLKLALVLLGTGSALLAHARYGSTLDRAPAGALRLTATISLLCWLGALLCGRLIAFWEG